MKTPVIIIGDLHIGIKNNSQLFLEYMKSYFQNELFPLIKKYNVKHVIQLGDTLDKRKNIDFITSAFLIKEWLSWFDENNVKLYSLIGNHDTYYKNTNELSGIKQYESLFNNINIISKPSSITIDNTEFICIPWICSENKDEISEYIENIRNTNNERKFRIICGHFELAGFNINKKFISKDGNFKTSEFEAFDHVFSGHFHTPSEQKNIQYIGSPYWLTWNDYGDKKKIILLDANDPLNTIKNIYTKVSLFHKIVYQPGENIEYNFPYGSYVKVIVNEPDELLDVFINDITNKYNLSQCQIIDTSNNLFEQQLSELDNIEVDDPFHILMKSIENIKDPFISSELFSIYKEAQSLES